MHVVVLLQTIAFNSWNDSPILLFLSLLIFVYCLFWLLLELATGLHLFACAGLIGMRQQQKWQSEVTRWVCSPIDSLASKQCAPTA